MSASPERAKTVPAPIPTGAVIAGKYRLDQLIAEGGMGLVYRGWHLVLDHAVAVKIVRPELAGRTDAVARFLSEARAVARLRGEHVARVLDSGCIKNGPPYMVLEYLEGCDVRSLLDTTGPLTVPRAIDLILQACEAMAEAHAQGIVHRDVKPENLFLTHQPDGTESVKLLDFGISKQLDADSGRSFTMQGQSLGSPHYMAPEQMSTPSQVDTRADIWSLGVVAFEMLSGELPFDGDTVPSVCAQVLCRTPKPLSSLRRDAPRALEAVIARCLCKKPSQRYASVKELAEALAPFATPAGVRSVARVRRLFGEAIDDDGAPMAAHRADERTPTPRLHSTTEINFRLPRRPLWPVAVAFLAAAVVALGVRNWDDVEASAVSTASAVSVRAREIRELAVERLADPVPKARTDAVAAPVDASTEPAPRPLVQGSKPAAPPAPSVEAPSPPVVAKRGPSVAKPRYRAPRAAQPPSKPIPEPAPAPRPAPLRGLSELRAPFVAEPLGTVAAEQSGAWREVTTTTDAAVEVDAGSETSVADRPE